MLVGSVLALPLLSTYLHRGVEADFGYAVFAFDFGDCALAVGEVDGVAVGNEVFRYAVAGR